MVSTALTFDETNWRNEQKVLLKGNQADTSEIKPYSVVFELESADPNYNGLSITPLTIDGIELSSQATLNPKMPLIPGHYINFSVESLYTGNGTLTYTLHSGPTGMEIGNETGDIDWRIDAGDAGKTVEAVIHINDAEGQRETLPLTFDVAQINNLNSTENQNTLSVDNAQHPLKGLSVSINPDNAQNITTQQLTIQDLGESGTLPDYVTAIGPTFRVKHQDGELFSTTGNVEIHLDGLTLENEEQRNQLRLFAWFEHSEGGKTWHPFTLDPAHLKNGSLVTTSYVLGLPMRLGLIPQVLSTETNSIENQITKNNVHSNALRNEETEARCELQDADTTQCQMGIYKFNFRYLENTNWGENLDYEALSEEMLSAVDMLINRGLLPSFEYTVESKLSDFQGDNADDAGWVSEATNWTNLKINPTLRTPERYRNVIFHELFHAVHGSNLPQIFRHPRERKAWITEGLATWFEQASGHPPHFELFPIMFLGGLTDSEDITPYMTYLLWQLIDKECGGLGHEISFSSLSNIGPQSIHNHGIEAVTAALQNQCQPQLDTPGSSELIRLIQHYVYATIVQNDATLLGINEQRFNFAGLQADPQRLPSYNTSSLSVGEEKEINIPLTPHAIMPLLIKNSEIGANEELYVRIKDKLNRANIAASFLALPPYDDEFQQAHNIGDDHHSWFYQDKKIEYVFDFDTDVPDIFLTLLNGNATSLLDLDVFIGKRLKKNGFIISPFPSAQDNVAGDRTLIKGHEGWQLSDEALNLSGGNIDWKGDYNDQGKPKKVLSWLGPRSRYFPDSISRSLHTSLPYCCQPRFPLDTAIYQEGVLFSTAPAPVLGAAIQTDGSGKEWIVSVCDEDDNDVVYRRPNTLNTSADLYHEETAPEGWQKIATLPRHETALAPFTSWFFNGDGTEAQTMRMFWDNTHCQNCYRLDRIKLTVNENSADWENLGNDAGRGTETILAVDYVDDREVLLRQNTSVWLKFDGNALFDNEEIQAYQFGISIPEEIVTAFTVSTFLADGVYANYFQLQGEMTIYLYHFDLRTNTVAYVITREPDFDARELNAFYAVKHEGAQINAGEIELLAGRSPNTAISINFMDSLAPGVFGFVNFSGWRVGFAPTADEGGWAVDREGSLLITEPRFSSNPEHLPYFDYLSDGNLGDFIKSDEIDGYRSADPVFVY